MDHDVTSDPNAGSTSRAGRYGDGRVGEDPVLRIEEGLKATQVEKIDVGDGAGANLHNRSSSSTCVTVLGIPRMALACKIADPVHSDAQTWVTPLGAYFCSGVKQGVAIRVFL